MRDQYKTGWLDRVVATLLRALHSMVAHPALLVGVILISIYGAIALIAPLAARPVGNDPYVLPRYGLVGDPEPPSLEHPLGLMQDRYDMLYGMVWGTRVAFRVGLLITLGRALIGITIGLISGYYGGRIDALMMRITDAFMAFPIVAGVLIMLTLFAGDQFGIQKGEGVDAIEIALIAFGWMQYARLVRGNVLVERSRDYVYAAVSTGARDRRILFRHILPNAAQGLFVMLASDVGAMVVTMAALTFIGLSGDKPLADWGMMLKYSRNWIVGAPTRAFEYWYTYVPPVVAIVLFSVGWGLIGDGLRETLDPRLRGVHLR
ncbi:MAG: ABC transporter permease [Chloroflexi bacterium]|nr:ABC transporter permease [Chloroflexota bacterium]